MHIYVIYAGIYTVQFFFNKIMLLYTVQFLIFSNVTLNVSEGIYIVTKKNVSKNVYISN